MKRKIIFIEIISTILTLIILLIVSSIYINNHNNNTAKDELLSYSNIACEVFDGSNFEETKNVISSAGKDLRITIIDQKGEVVIDSKLFEADNHLNREEIINLEKYIIRYSDSLKVNMMYYATFYNGYYIRIALPIDSLNAFINNYVGFGSIALIIILSISTIITLLLYKKTLYPIKKEINNLETILGHNLTEDTEFEHLSSKISDLTKVLDEKVTSLLNEQEKTKYILDNMNQGLVLLDKTGKVELINKYALSLFSFIQEHILNKSYIYLFRDTEIQTKIKECIFEKKEDQCIFDFNGKKYLLYINLLDKEWSNAINSRIALLIVDITLQESISSLKREFFANASHELKSPLTSIIGYQQLIQQRILTTPEEIQDATLRTIKEAQRMNKLIIEMLDISRLENNVQTLIEEVDVSKIVLDTLAELQPQLEKKEIILETKLSENIIKGSQSDLYKLIKNIIDNAIVYNNIGGKITVELNDNTLTINDTGVGISKEDLEHIFDRFYRVDKARSKASSGTGLGLSIVKHICILYGYKITVDSILGKGTKFTINLK